MIRGGLNGVLPSPLPRGGLVSRTVSLVHVRDLGDQRIVGVWVRKHGADGEEDYRGGGVLAGLMIHAISVIPPIGVKNMSRDQESSVSMHLTFAYGQRRAPLVPQDIQANATIAVDVGVVNAGSEVDLRWLERVVGGEVNREEEDAAGIGRVAGSHDGRLPVELHGKHKSVLVHGISATCAAE